MIIKQLSIYAPYYSLPIKRFQIYKHLITKMSKCQRFLSGVHTFIITHRLEKYLELFKQTETATYSQIFKKKYCLVLSRYFYESDHVYAPEVNGVNYKKTVHLSNNCIFVSLCRCIYSVLPHRHQQFRSCNCSLQCFNSRQITSSAKR